MSEHEHQRHSAMNGAEQRCCGSGTHHFLIILEINISISFLLANKTLLVPVPHMLEKLVRRKEGFMTELFPDGAFI